MATCQGLMRETWSQLPDPEEFALVDHFIEGSRKSILILLLSDTLRPRMELQHCKQFKWSTSVTWPNASTNALIFLAGAAAALSEYVQLKYEFESEFNEM